MHYIEKLSQKIHFFLLLCFSYVFLSINPSSYINSSKAFLMKMTSLSSITSLRERRQVIKDSSPQNLGPRFSLGAPPLFSFFESLQCPVQQFIYCLCASPIAGPAVQSPEEYTSEFNCSKLHVTEVLITEDSVPAPPGRLMSGSSFFFRARQHFPSPGFTEEANCFPLTSVILTGVSQSQAGVSHITSGPYPDEFSSALLISRDFLCDLCSL